MTHPDFDEEEPDLEEPQGRIRVDRPRSAGGVGRDRSGAGLGDPAAVPAARSTPSPNVSLTSIGALVFVAATVGATAYVTRRTVRRNRFDLAHHAGRQPARPRQGVRPGRRPGPRRVRRVRRRPARRLQPRGRRRASGARCSRRSDRSAVMVAALLLEQACRVPKGDK